MSDELIENIEERSSCGCSTNHERDEMLMKIRQLDFAINELSLYLDTHPNDQKALCMHKEYCKMLKELKDKYQKKYGPLTIYYPCNKWRWLEEPWAWFVLDNNMLQPKLIKDKL